jgi:hypothetical protein
MAAIITQERHNHGIPSNKSLIVVLTGLPLALAEPVPQKRPWQGQGLGVHLPPIANGLEVRRVRARSASRWHPGLVVRSIAH